MAADDTIRLPASEAERVALIRDRLLKNIQAATDDLAGHLSKDVEVAIKRIQDGQYRRSVVKKTTAWLVNRHYSRLSEAIGDLIASAAGLTRRYRRMVDAYTAHGLKGAKVFSGTEAAHLIRDGKAAVKAAIAAETIQGSAGPITSTAGGEYLEANVKPWRKARSLSKRLHPRKVATTRDIARNVSRAISEAKQIESAASEMIQAVRRARTGEVAGQTRMSKLLQRFKKAGGDLAKRGGPAEIEAWNKARRQIERYIPRLAEGGRLRMNLIELLQRTRDGASMVKLAKARKASSINARVDSVIRHHMADKQRYAAERILRTETAVAYKARQIAEDESQGFISHYIWRMNRGARALFKRRTKPSRKFFRARARRSRRRLKGPRRRCICEALDGKKITILEAKARPIGHPNCLCWLEPVLSTDRMKIAGSEWGD